MIVTTEITEEEIIIGLTCYEANLEHLEYIDDDDDDDERGNDEW